MNFETRRESDTAYKTQNKTSYFKHIISDVSWINKIMNENNNNKGVVRELCFCVNQLKFNGTFQNHMMQWHHW